MGGKSGGGSSATNQQLVNMQMQQAAQAETSNAERNARLTAGKAAIDAMFQGTPAGATKLDFSGAPYAGPSGTESAQMGWGLTAPNMPAGYSMTMLPDDGSGTPQYGLVGPTGGLVNSGSLQDIANTQIYSGGSGANVDPFAHMYDTLRSGVLNYYLPQEGEQYNTARTNLNYSLARAGSLNSSIAGTDVAKLANQDMLNRAQIQAQADTQVGAFRNTVQQDQQSALNQLYSTEDPSVAANTAENMVANAQLTKPMLNPMGSLFSAITAGVGNAISGYTNPYAYIGQGPGAMTSGTPSGSQGQGQTISGSG
jgi:hypothetical protein